ncbi:hypothetical protein SAICODRAFT_7747 [Saitoella complicata NRRL Y-17804]|uniref:Uncharacterized protein n=1 Tax=Saitoella complicata (strain BCRC 22490 / CBS 7301 / JCM 7358 / NBRC 10748 / NRRL Y-17804) TaxID=698492 RepID=A0A0E9NC85_SAICN|nr:uncharacterized protein SAICODRAFT_7747 [Saitoella complicata NRRL Y-17804]ODQ52711.1 hypothetical protein SAICODRAFT_7747 [Saitoella complicata NRRL Y-17804]GAO47439.1 hypothetical protein G7K_1647-t1 [Saitoella complicata NRRL Y-17804]
MPIPLYPKATSPPEDEDGIPSVPPLVPSAGFEQPTAPTPSILSSLNALSRTQLDRTASSRTPPSMQILETLLGQIRQVRMGALPQPPPAAAPASDIDMQYEPLLNTLANARRSMEAQGQGDMSREYQETLQASVLRRQEAAAPSNRIRRAARLTDDLPDTTFAAAAAATPTSFPGAGAYDSPSEDDDEDYGDGDGERSRGPRRRGLSATFSEVYRHETRLNDMRRRVEELAERLHVVRHARRLSAAPAALSPPRPSARPPVPEPVRREERDFDHGAGRVGGGDGAGGTGVTGSGLHRTATLGAGAGKSARREKVRHDLRMVDEVWGRGWDVRPMVNLGEDGECEEEEAGEEVRDERFLEGGGKGKEGVEDMMSVREGLDESPQDTAME